jgi:ribonuclease HI
MTNELLRTWSSEAIPEVRAAGALVERVLEAEPLAAADGCRFLAYTDGSCLRNPDGPAGFAAVLLSETSGRSWELAAHLASSTNNRAEWAALAAALLFTPPGARLRALSDSQYVLNVALGRWKRKANLDLWQVWDQLRQSHPVDLELEWVRGHADDPGNERADALATLAAHQFDQTRWQAARAGPEPTDQTRALLALARGDWERQFLRDVGRRLQRGQPLSPKQQAVIDRIAARAPR